MIDHQRLLKTASRLTKALAVDKKMDKTSGGELLHNNVRTRNCANRDKKIERLDGESPYSFASRKTRLNQFAPIAAENLSWAEAQVK